MSKLYNERTTERSFFERAYKVEIDNELDTAPKLKFLTEEIMVTDGREQVTKKLRSVEDVYTGNETFDIYDPTTGEVIGQSDYDTVFVQMYSLFFHVATKNDGI